MVYAFEPGLLILYNGGLVHASVFPSFCLCTLCWTILHKGCINERWGDTKIFIKSNMSVHYVQVWLALNFANLFVWFSDISVIFLWNNILVMKPSYWRQVWLPNFSFCVTIMSMLQHNFAITLDIKKEKCN